MPRAQARKEREQAGVALLLAWVAGFVDAVGYLALFQMFTAQMSGNTVGMAVMAGEQDWADALHRAFPIPVFVLGVGLSAAAGELLVRRGVRTAFALTLGLEALLLLVFMGCGHPVLDGARSRAAVGWPFYLLAALPALAMGVQNAALRRAGKGVVRTTFITGMLADTAEEAVRYLFWLCDRYRQRRQRLGVLLRLSPRQPAFNRMLLMLGIWVLYATGAVVGACADLRWGLQCLVAPIGGLTLLALVTAQYPLPLAVQVIDEQTHPEPRGRGTAAVAVRPRSRPG